MTATGTPSQFDHSPVQTAWSLKQTFFFREQVRSYCAEVEGLQDDPHFETAV